MLKELISRARRVVLAHSDKSVAGTRAARVKILLLCASFSFLFFGPSSSKLRTGHQMSQMARSCHPAASLLFPRRPPRPRRRLLPSPRMCFSGGSAVLLKRRALLTGVQAAPSPVVWRYITPPYVGRAVLISEALMRIGNVFSLIWVIFFFFFPALKQPLKDSMKSVLRTWDRGKTELLRVQIKLFITLCKLSELLNCINTETNFLLPVPNHSLEDSLEQAVTQ